jgi:hypothetical protein
MHSNHDMFNEPHDYVNGSYVKRPPVSIDDPDSATNAVPEPVADPEPPEAA